MTYLRSLSLFSFLILLLPILSIDSVQIETIGGKKFRKVKVVKESESEIQFEDEDGIILRIRKEKVKSISPDLPEGAPEISSDESLPSPKPVEEKSPLPEHSVQLTQFLSNDGAFQGASLFGEKQARRNNMKYTDYYESYYLTSSVNLLGLPPQLRIAFTVMNPLVDRTNTDSDGFFQNTSGGKDQTQTINQFIQTGQLGFDPNETKLRKEKNGLNDYLFTTAAYEHLTKLGAFSVGFLFINVDDPTFLMRGYLVFGWKPPFLDYLNPQLTVNSKMLSETNGAFQGTHNVRLTLSHEYFKGRLVQVTPSLVTGYQDVNDNIDRKKGISDVSPRIQFNYSDFFIALNWMYRATPSLVDNQLSTPSSGVYQDTNATDGKTTDPSKVHGYLNQATVDYIRSNSPNEYVSRELIQHYQSQHIVRGIYFFNIGYSIRI
ncbi:hypothetical protein [Leptospira stimsonii]|uniref:Uncharacterized protein n=1 Tax=Leptospira stimsonii TaxID=2202203 RepID=A0A8B3CTY0_9LEPT|nr:hypothetical protein [Leptospira stimsonii]RHX87694.1 hypothetical protein DLM78_01475 [Leptospira stimsonii]